MTLIVYNPENDLLSIILLTKDVIYTMLSLQLLLQITAMQAELSVNECCQKCFMHGNYSVGFLIKQCIPEFVQGLGQMLLLGQSL